MYKVLLVEGGYAVFWLDSPDTEPILVPRPTDNPEDRRKPYPIRQAAYRRCKKLNDALQKVNTMIAESGAIIL